MFRFCLGEAGYAMSECAEMYRWATRLWDLVSHTPSRENSHWLSKWECSNDKYNLCVNISKNKRYSYPQLSINNQPGIYLTAIQIWLEWCEFCPGEAVYASPTARRVSDERWRCGISERGTVWWELTRLNRRSICIFQGMLKEMDIKGKSEWHGNKPSLCGIRRIYNLPIRSE
jgi:hypothetical protein